MATIVGISGSLRRGSYNTMLLRAAADLVPEGSRIEIASIREIPLYDGDLDAADGPPSVVRELKERIAAADGLLLATPEYNNSLPGVAKNAIDWLSRPARDRRRVFGDLPVAIIGATTGRGGAVMGQAAWLPIFRALGTRPWFGRNLNVASARELFGESGLEDEETRARLARFVEEFVEFVVRNPRRRPDERV